MGVRPTRIPMHASLLLLTAALALPAQAEVVESQSVSPTDCTVSLIEEREVSAAEPGLIAKMEAREGMLVRAGTVLGNIDDEEAQAHLLMKKWEFTAAKQQSESNVDERYAVKASGVAESAWQKAVQANQRTENAVTPVDVQRLKLDYERAFLGIEKAQLDQKVAQSTMEMKGAEVKAAKLNISRREIRSPIDGLVVKVNRRVGEWVSPGDPVVRIMRFDRLHIKGNLDASQYDPVEIKGRKVRVDVELARRRKATVTGKIVFVSPEVAINGEYEVWAEVENRLEHNEWLLRPGMPATMAIYLNDALAASAVPPQKKR